MVLYIQPYIRIQCIIRQQANIQMKKQANPSQGYQKITHGQYELHVLIQSTSALSLSSDSSIDVKVVVTAFGKSEHTKVKSKIGVEETFWGEHFYFQKVFDSRNSGQNQRVLIQAYDHNKLLTSSLVGSYQIDIQRIYSQKNHTLNHTWLALSNIQKKFSQITGYVKISASFLGQKDQNVELEVEPIASITKQKKILAPPEIERKIYQIVVDIIEGKSIKPADGNTVDSYLGVQFGQIFSVSDTVLKDTEPKYYSRVFLPISLPAAIQNIAFRLHDYNMIQKTEVLGSYYLNINNIVKQLNSIIISPNQKPRKSPEQLIFQQRPPINQFQWVNFYGPQNANKRQDQKNIQQFFPNIAPFYVGSILMRVRAQEATMIEIKKQKIGKTEHQQVVAILATPCRFFKVTALITGALGLFFKNQKHRISIRVGSQQMETNQSVAKNGFCLWNVQRAFTIKVHAMQTIPDIFVYLLDEKKNRICYQRYKPANGLVLQDQWVKLLPDPAVIDIHNEQAGYLKIGLTLFPTDRLEQPSGINITNNLLGPTYLNNRRSGRIVIDLFCASQLLPLDQDGSIDAYFTFSYLNSQISSSLKNDSLNPNYYQRLILETDVLNQEDSPPIIVRAYDKDKTRSQFLGQSYIDIGQAIKKKSLCYGQGRTPSAAWYTLYQNELIAGKFLCSFIMLPNYIQSIPRGIDIPVANYQLTLVIMGLRGLKNTGLLSIKQPFIQFDLGSLDFANKLTKQIKQKKIVRTEPKQKGRSININSVVPAKVMLPKQVSYWPSLTAKVRDNVIGQVYQPTLGYFAVNLQKSFKKSQMIRAKFAEQRKILSSNRKQIISKPPKLANVNDNVLMSIRNFILKSLNYNWKTMSSSIGNKLNCMAKNPDKPLDSDYIVIFPYYQREATGRNSKIQQSIRYVEKYKDAIQKNGEYMQIGYDNNKSRASEYNKRQKHYRYVLNQPFQVYYQRVNGVKMGVMEEIPIKIGRHTFNKNDIVSNVIRKISKQDQLSGTFKGQVFISQISNNTSNSILQFQQNSKQLLKLLLKKQKVHLYLYIIQAANLPQKDQFSMSDPYIRVKAGKQDQQFKKSYIENQSNPQFFQKVHMVLSFPQDSSIDIQIWDYDPVGADQLIGVATIDMENRLQSKLTSSRFNNPIQTHNLYNPISKRPQGLVRFWIDLISMQNVSLYRQFDISRRASSSFELRVIVWEVEGMPNNDLEDVSDLYVDCAFNGQTQSTDVHYRSVTGDGKFNWRMVFPLKMPIKQPLISFRVFDRDIVTSNDFLASASFSIQEYLDQAYQTDSSVILLLGTEDLSEDSDVKTGKKHLVNGQARYDRFQLITMNKLHDKQIGSRNNLNQQGKIQVSIQILTAEQALKRPAGKGREAPNQHPFLPQPKGRYQVSMNPIKMLGQLCGPKFKKYGCLIITLIIIIVLIVFLIFPFAGSIAGSAIGSRTA